MKVSKFIKSPLNYTGNKHRLLPQFCEHFPKHSHTFVDLFCGGATVGINVSADEIIMIDNNPRVISLLKYLAKVDINHLIIKIEKIIEKYHLTYSAKYGYSSYKKTKKDNNGLKEFNKEGYYQLRADYNQLKCKSSNQANAMLYTLMVYAFNNDIRFNGKDQFNLPVGKTDFNKNNYQKIKEYNERVKNLNIKFICTNFNSKLAKKYLLEADFVYIDPPYLITTAVYNEESGWNNKAEANLIKLLDKLNEHNVKFALSNVLTKAGKENKILNDWLMANRNIKVHPIKYHYRSSSYHKKDRAAGEQEVLIMNEE